MGGVWKLPTSKLRTYEWLEVHDTASRVAMWDHKFSSYTQNLQEPLLKEYTVDHDKEPRVIEGRLIDSGLLEALRTTDPRYITSEPTLYQHLMVHDVGNY